MRRIPVMTVLTGGALVALFIAYMVSFQVRFNEVAVRVRLGKPDANSVITTPGPQFRWPYPLETVRKYDTRLRVLDTPEAEIKTRDQKNVIIGVYALWRIKDPMQYSIRLETDKVAEQQLRSRLNDVRAAVIGKYDMSAFVGLDEAAIEKNYTAIETELRDLAAPGILTSFGVELVTVGIRRISLPEQVTQAVFASQQAERQTIAMRYRSEGASQAQAIRSRAESAANQIKQFAETKAAAIAAAGQESSARYLAQIKDEDRDFFIWLRAMDALKIALKEKSTFFFDTNSQLARLLMQPPADGKPPKVQSDARDIPAGESGPKIADK